MAIENELEKRRLGLDFAAKLLMLSADSPDVAWEKKVQDLANEIQRSVTFTKNRRKHLTAVLLRKNGGMTAKEISEATRFHIDRLRDLLKDMEAEGLVERRKVHPSGPKGGRPVEVFYLLAESFSASKT